MTKHTEGPWGIEDRGPVNGFEVHTEEWVVDDSGTEVREVIGHAWDGDNARLIAAAPDLLDVAIEARDALTDCREHLAIRRRLDAAIRQATGEG